VHDKKDSAGDESFQLKITYALVDVITQFAEQSYKMFQECFVLYPIIVSNLTKVKLIFA
jgi:hypothetical protein